MTLVGFENVIYVFVLCVLETPPE
uniref:Uncharacterized protein n=1 Tax=Rhizophora mucronata TaxID=61149 RepID=A0A2P2QVU4_RHIMU